MLYANVVAGVTIV